MKDRIIATEQYNVDLCNNDQIIAMKHTLWIYVSVQKDVFKRYQNGMVQLQLKVQQKW